MRKIKSIAIIMLSLLMFVFASSPALAKQGTNELISALSQLGKQSKYMIVDDTNSFTEQDLQQLKQKFKEVSDKYNINIGLFIVEDLGAYSKISEVADEFYEASFVPGSDGVCLVVHASGPNGEKRYIDVCGNDCRRAINADAIQYIGENLKSTFDNGDNLKGALVFADYVDELETMSKNGKPYVSKGSITKQIVVSLVIGVIIALIVCLYMRSKLKSVKMQHGASDYTRPGSMNVDLSRDWFLYSHVDRVAKPKDSGGSHKSSSGNTFTGGGF